MIYLKERFNIHPASPATRDRFVEAVEKLVIPSNEPLGARQVAAWFSHEEWFSQIEHVTEFEDLGALGAWREAGGEVAEGRAALAELAPERSVQIVEPLGPIPVASLHAGIEAAGQEPAGTYTYAILEVAPGCIDPFAQLLGAAKDHLPIIACWRDVTGNPNRVIDLWKGDVGRHGYKPNDDGQEAFFGPLRKIAPREHMQRLHPLPYSPLR